MNVPPSSHRARWAQHLPSSCSSCITGSADVRRPWGRNGSLVWVCWPCVAKEAKR